MALLDGGLVGAITASNNATIVLWPEAVLRATGDERNLSLLPGCIHCFNSVGEVPAAASTARKC